MALNVLYISYDGVIDPLGQSQVLPYLTGLAKGGNEFTLISFEKKNRLKDKEKIKKLKAELSQNKIHWKALRYHKSPPVLSTLYDFLRGITICLFLIKKGQISFVHVRSYVPALMALLIKKMFAILYIFDMRGFWVDERVEGNLWKANGILYKTAKYLEKRLLINAEKIIVLTQNMKTEIQNFDFLKNRSDFLSVIPTCVDLNRFDYKKSEINSPTLETFLVYSGSLGTVYLIDEMLRFYSYLKKVFPYMKFKILTHSPKELIHATSNKLGIQAENIIIKQVDYENMATELNKSNLGIAFYKPTYSAMGRAPTKLGEYLACGIPVIVNAGVGDLDGLIRKERIGVTVESFSDLSIQQAIADLKKLIEENDSLKERCKNVAKQYFSLDDGIKKYSKIYKTLTN